MTPGPYKPEARSYWLERLLTVQTLIRKNPKSPEEVLDIELINMDELREIRRIWVEEKYEVEDLLPELYERVTGELYPDQARYEDSIFSKSSLSLLKNVTGDDEISYETIRNLLEIERRHRYKGSRRGLFKELENTLERGLHKTPEEAMKWVQTKIEVKNDTDKQKRS